MIYFFIYLFKKVIGSLISPKITPLFIFIYQIITINSVTQTPLPNFFLYTKLLQLILSLKLHYPIYFYIPNYYNQFCRSNSFAKFLFIYQIITINFVAQIFYFFKSFTIMLNKFSSQNKKLSFSLL